MMRERLDLKVQRPTEAERFAAAKLRELADEFEKLADSEDSWEWRRASAKAAGAARDLDGDEPWKVRIQLTEEEAYALSDFMDGHFDASYGGSWRTGRSGAIDWTTFELVVSKSADAGGHIPEAIGWVRLGGSGVPPLLQSVRDKILAVARSYRRGVS